MNKSILDYLEITEKKYPNKIAFVDSTRKITFNEFVNEASKIGTSISKFNYYNKPIVIFIDKTINCLSSMMGILYSSNFYAIIDTLMPKNRVDNIINTLNPVLILTDNKNKQKILDYNYDINVMTFEDELNNSINNELLTNNRNRMIDSDPMYVLFTSGSTGLPKGSVISHKSVIAYSHWVKETFNINSKTIFGSQTPFYFSMSITDIFSTIISGATFYIIPKMYFSFPIKLIEYMNENKINTIYWVPSALCIVANLKTFDVLKPKYLKKVLFAGEVMPMPQLNIWIKALPKIFYANLYGPTETTDICTYYVVNRKFNDNETLPIGKPCNNCDVIVVNEKNEEAEYGEPGELYVRGSFLSYGYYNNDEKTASAFIQNPINKAYPEKVYKTGDIVKYNEFGELIYLSRKDFQIKHMGYRIELGEIETNINALDGIILCACIYDSVSQKIVLYFESNKLSENDVIEYSKNKLLKYMQPNVIIKLNKMPYNSNGKIDRVKLKNDYINEGEK